MDGGVVKSIIILVATAVEGLGILASGNNVIFVEVLTLEDGEHSALAGLQIDDTGEEGSVRTVDGLINIGKVAVFNWLKS